jgi:voltage-gated potassium channel
VRLTDGTFFGEIALLHKTKRSGTVTATRKTRLLVLDAQDFHALIARMPTLAAHVHKTAKARLEESGDVAAAELAQGEREGTDR